MSKQKTISSMKGERREVDYYDREGKLRFVMTSSPARDEFYLYAVHEEKMTRLGKGRSPIVLEEKFEVAKKQNA